MASDLAPHRPVALAGNLLEAGPVHDRHVASSMRDRPEPLELGEGDRHGRPLHAEAQRQELVGHHELIVEAEVAGGEEVASRAGDDVMMAIARGGDRALPNDRGGMVMQASVQLLSLIHISEPTRLGMISYAVFCLK